jgi:glucokinase
MNGFTLGVDIGGTKISTSVVDRSGSLVSPVMTVETPASAGASTILDAAFGLIERGRATHPGIHAVGVGSAGVFDARGVVVSSTDLLSGWIGTDVSGILSARSALPVVTVNDVHAAAVGEHAIGAASGCDTALVVAVGTGVGGAIIMNGAVSYGRAGVAGSVGHVTIASENHRRCSCGEVDHVEPHASGIGMELSYFENTGRTLSLRDIAALARGGDAIARETIRSGASLLAGAIASAVNLIDPEIVVVGGGVAQIGDLYLDAVSRRVATLALGGAATVPVVAAKLGSSSALIGAGLLAHRIAANSV